jgi:ATP-dependent Clp endopeptidase proteolytic subunit ClpP
MPDRETDRGRNLYLFGETNDDTCQEIVARILEEWNREFLLVINSDGGSSFNALAVVNVLKAHGRTDTVCLGVALSGAADILAAGRRRYIVPGAIAMVHQVSWDLGTEFAANLVKNAIFLQRLNEQFAEMLSRDTGQTRDRLIADMTTDHYLFGQEIIDYGLADGYWEPGTLLKRPAGDRSRRPVAETFEKLRRV